jgi:digeranylgeranylglycerophospholipid reductase
MEDKCDVLIVGGGFAGAGLAWFLSRMNGLRIVLIDSKEKGKMGDKPCGDAVGKEHFDKLGLPVPVGKALEHLVEGIKIYSPDKETAWIVKGEGYELDPPSYVDLLLSDAVKKGVEVMEKTTFVKPLLEGNKIIGGTIYDRKNNKSINLHSKVIVDASGNAAAVRSKLPRELPVTEEIDDLDTNIAYREVVITESEIEEPGILEIYLNQRTSPGGYWWMFPKGKNKANIGLGVQGGKGYPPPKYFYEKYFSEVLPNLKVNEVLVRGGALVATRRPLTTMAWNNFIAIGDAAYTVNPVHGGGKGSSLISAYCASKALEEAISRSSFNAEDLWSINECYISRYGAKQASLDFFRLFLQGLSDQDINYGMKRGLIKEEDLLEISLTGDLKLSIAEKAIRLLSGLGRPSLLVKLKTVADCMKRLKQLYSEYPKKPEGLEVWRARVEELYKEYKKSLL